MPSQPEARPERRGGGRSAPTMMMQGYEAMGHGGRRRLRWAGYVMMAAAGGTALWRSSGDPSVYWWLFTGVIFLCGVCFVFPQMGLQLIEAIPTGLAKILPTKLLSRPDRRGDEEQPG